MTHQLTITPETDRLVWRRQLIEQIKPQDEVVITFDGELSFTQLRQLITSLNTVAWQRQATVRYSTDRAATIPPLPIRYAREPSITPPKIC